MTGTGLPPVVLGFAVGGALAASVVLLAAACLGWRFAPSGGERSLRVWLRSTSARRAGLATVAAVPVALVTRWPVMAAAAMLLVWVWPSMFGAGRESAARIARLEAVAIWTESMRDTIAGSIALEEAIRNTASSAPEVIQGPLRRLLGSVSVQVPLAQALAQFAEEFEDESIDLVAAALILNAQLRGPGLAATLTALATSAREELDMRRRTEQEQKALRRDARTIMGTALGFAAVLILFSRPYMAPYGTLEGQLVLGVVIGIFVAGLVWMRRLARVREHERFLVGPQTLVERNRAFRDSQRVSS